MKMKDSGVEWIEEIPEKWDVEKISQLFKQRNVKVSDFDYPPLSVTKNGIVPQLESAAKSDDHTNRKLVKKDDFVINSRSDRKMSSGVSNLDGSVSLINLVMSYNYEKLNSRFVNYMMKNYGFAEEFYRWGTGIVADLWSTNWERGKNIQLPVPKIDEQQKIADFLDSKIALIDQIITDTKRSIEELKAYKQSLITETVTKGLDPNVSMKSSKLDFLKTIPQNWKEHKFGFIAKVDANLVNPKEYLNFYQVASDSIEKGSGRVSLNRTVADSGVESYNYLFREGQILYSKIRPSLNKVAIAPYDGLCSADMYPLSVKGNSRFIIYMMMSDYFLQQVELVTQNRVKMPKINKQELSEIRVAFPDETEQQEIADYIDKQTIQIDKLVKDKLNIIATLESYKKSLIYEYVTGKKQVN